MARLLNRLLLASVLLMPGLTTGSDAVTLSEVQLLGTKQLTADDIVRGLNLKIGGVTTRQDLLRACGRFQQLKLFPSSHCQLHIRKGNASLTVFVEEKWRGLPVVFDNFVWTTRDELLGRLKQELPLFMPELPKSSGLTGDIIRVLDKIVGEHGVKGPVRYDDSFWTERDMNVFYIEGLSTPVAQLLIEGDGAPPAEKVLDWSQFYTKEDFSAARLTWVISWVVRDLYASRGYLRPIVGRPALQCLEEKNGTHPVRVILSISSGAQYTFDSVSFEGLAKNHAAELFSEWKLKPGDPYDEPYARKFVFEILNRLWAKDPKTQSGYAPTCRTIDEASKKVSLVITVEDPKSRKSWGKQSEGCGGVPIIPVYHVWP